MIGALRYEWARLRTVRSTWWLTFFALLLHGLIAFAVARGGARGTLDLDLVTALLTGGASGSPLSFPAIFMGVIGILAFGHEYRHGLIRTTLVALPRRSRVLIAKVLVVALWSAAVAAACVLLAYVIGSLVVGDGWTLSLIDRGPTLRVLAGFVALVVLTGLLGLGLAGLFRSVPAAIVVLLIVPLVVEPMLQLLVNLPSLEAFAEYVRYLPFEAGQRMMATGAGTVVSGVSSLSPLTGGLTFLGFVAAICAATALLFRLRDA